MTLLDEYFNNNYSTPVPSHIDTGQVTIRAVIPPLYQVKINSIIRVKGYSNSQEYITALFKEDPEVEEIIIPYEILKLIDEDYRKLYGGG